MCDRFGFILLFGIGEQVMHKIPVVIQELQKNCSVKKDMWGGAQNAYILTFSFGAVIITTVRIVLKDLSGADLAITNMNTQPYDQRRNGYGSLALQVVLRCAREQDLKDIRAIQVSNRAFGFWKKNGFRSLGNTTNDFIYTREGD